ncbi:hypothetical protein [Timonella sp. A28]|uniref:hypothetical protein n=1 Tax=Timonella sp. A28 TaxID=3442640 RepID=UPI003EBE5647
MNTRLATLTGSLFVLYGLVYPIPSITRQQMRVPVDLAESITVHETSSSWLIAADATFTAKASGIGLFATEQTTIGVIALTIGFVILVGRFDYVRSQTRHGRPGLWTAIALIVGGFVPEAVMRAIDTAALTGHDIPGELAFRTPVQCTLLMSLLGVALLIMRRTHPMLFVSNSRPAPDINMKTDVR